MEDAVRLVLAIWGSSGIQFCGMRFFTRKAAIVQSTTLYMMGFAKKKMAGRWITIRKERIMTTMKIQFLTLLCSH